MRAREALTELIVTVAGRRLGASDTSSIASVHVRHALARPAQCLITWRLQDSTASRRLAVATGDPLRVELGGAARPLFAGDITVVEHAYGPDASLEVRVRAYDALHRLRMRMHTRVHEDADLTGLATALAEGTGLAVAGPAVRLGAVHQVARSDLDLLVTAAARVGAYPVVDGGSLRLVDLGGEGEPVELSLGTTLHSAEIEVSQEPSYRRAEVFRWEPTGGAAGSGRAAVARARADVVADPAPQTTGGGGVHHRADEVLADDGLAEALAQAELDVRGAGEVTAVLVADGDPRLRAGGRVRVAGVASPLEGTYTVCEAVHTIDGTGYSTTVSSHPPAPPPPRPADVLTLGLVEDVEDPEQRARVRVRLVGHDDLATAWAPVLLPAVGPGKGVVTLPDAGDTVLVALPGGDPAHAVVLGALHGPERTHDAGDAGPRGGRYSVRTADGQRVVLDGHARSLTLTDGHGSVVELGPDLLRVSAATDLLLEAPGRALTIRAGSVDFEEAP